MELLGYVCANTDEFEHSALEEKLPVTQLVLRSVPASPFSGWLEDAKCDIDIRRMWYAPGPGYEVTRLLPRKIRTPLRTT